MDASELSLLPLRFGLDCPDNRQVIHWGPSSDIESFVQEVGKERRDGYVSCSKVYYADVDFKNCPGLILIPYCQSSDICHRKLLFQDFDHSEQIT